MTKDPSVVLVGNVLGAACRNDILSYRYPGGILYVKNDQLCHEARSDWDRSKIHPYTLFRSFSRWNLARIKEICIVKDESVWVSLKNSIHVVTLKPGLKIRIYGTGTLFLVP